MLLLFYCVTLNILRYSTIIREGGGAGAYWDSFNCAYQWWTAHLAFMADAGRADGQMVL
jgi:hypothetical protein